MQFELIDDYRSIAKNIALKNSLLSLGEKPSTLKNVYYYFNLFITVVLLAGILTGFGAAAPIISGVLSLFSVVNIQIGYLALLAFCIYAIPWALVYIPDVSNLFRKNWAKKINTDHSLALDRAHNVLAMFYRKHLNRDISVSKVKALSSVGNNLIYLSFFDTLETFIAQSKKLEDSDTFIELMAANETFKLGHLLQKKAIENNSFDNLLKETAHIHLENSLHQQRKAFIRHRLFSTNASNDKLNKFLNTQTWLIFRQLIKSSNPLDDLIKLRKTYLNQTKCDLCTLITNKQLAQKIWEIQRKLDPRVSWWSNIASWLGSSLGFLNAAIANASGTALAPLYIISTLLMIYAIPNAVLPAYLAFGLVSAFASSGFIASFGITRKSIERSFVNMADFFLDIVKSQREHKHFSYNGPDYYMPIAYLGYINKRYAILPICASLFLSVAIASFNFLAGVTFAHILVTPGFIMQPTLVATFSVSSISALSAFELAFGIVGFGFTIIAVAPLMLCAWQNFIKSNKLEPWYTKPYLSIGALVTSAINTLLMLRMMLRPGSPLDLFFGATPWIIKTMTIIAPICIFILGFALFYMGLKYMIDDKGHSTSAIINETLILEPDYTCPNNLNTAFKGTPLDTGNSNTTSTNLNLGLS